MPTSTTVCRMDVFIYTNLSPVHARAHTYTHNQILTSSVLYKYTNGE